MLSTHRLPLLGLTLGLSLSACGTSTEAGPGVMADLAVAPDLAPSSSVDPPFGASSGGSGGAIPVAGAVRSTGGVTYRLIVPDGVETPAALIIVYSGTEGGANMTQNLTVAAAATNTDGVIRAVLDGVVYRGNGQAGAAVLDDVRARYDIDNDRTYLLGESAGTTAALALGFHVRQSWFAAFWANDVNASDAPAMSADDLGFAPWGNAGPGGDFIDAGLIVDGMRQAGYRIEEPAPYDGQGAGTHGDKYQFVAALRFFTDKTRR